MCDPCLTCPSPEAEPPVLQKFLHPERERLEIFMRCSHLTYWDMSGEGGHRRVPSGSDDSLLE